MINKQKRLMCWVIIFLLLSIFLLVPREMLYYYKAQDIYSGCYLKDAAYIKNITFPFYLFDKDKVIYRDGVCLVLTARVFYIPLFSAILAREKISWQSSDIQHLVNSDGDVPAQSIGSGNDASGGH